MGRRRVFIQRWWHAFLLILGGGLMSTLPKTSTNSFLENLSFTREVGCSGIQGKLTTNVKKTGTKLFSVPQMLSFGGVSFSGVSP